MPNGLPLGLLVVLAVPAFIASFGFSESSWSVVPENMRGHWSLLVYNGRGAFANPGTGFSGFSAILGEWGQRAA